MNLVGLGWGILAVGVQYQRTIPADEDKKLGLALFGMRANQDCPEMLPIMMCSMSFEKTVHWQRWQEYKEACHSEGRLSSSSLGKSQKIFGSS